MNVARLSFFALLLAFGTGCSTLHAEVEIKASPERVWQVLSELEKYPEWNPFFVRAGGKLRAGEELTVVMQPVGKSAQEFSPSLLEVKPGHSFKWRGRLFMPGLFDGTHEFRIVKLDADRVRFSQHEEFSGIFVPFAGFEPYEKGWILMNQALKQRAERAEAGARAAALPSTSPRH